MTNYDDAQICLNGHLISSRVGSNEEHRKSYCSECGKPTIMQCEHCNTNIRGYYWVPGAIVNFDKYKIPSYCHHCGEPYPWTQATIQECEEIVDMADELDEVDRAILKEKFPQLLIESPGTTAAALRVSKILKAASIVTVQALKSAVASKLAGRALEILVWK